MRRKFNKTYEEIVAYIGQHIGKKSVVEMAVELDISEFTIRRYAAREGMEFKSPIMRDESTELNEFIREHGSNYSAYQIAKAFGVNENTVRYRAYKFRLPLKKQDIKVDADLIPDLSKIGRSEFFNVDALEHGKTWLV